MPSAKNHIEWCSVRLGEDLNWWVKEVSDDVHWDVDGLSIVDPRQISHIIDLTEPLREYNFDQDLLDAAFIPFRIEKDLGDGIIRLVRSKESFFDSEDPLFGLPDIVDEENGPYADFLNHITKIRVNLLNDMIDFEQQLTIDEVEEQIREEENNSFIEGRAMHLFNEVTSILDYVPAGWELDSDDSSSDDEGEDIEDLPDIDDEEEAKKISESENLQWDEDEEEEKEDDVYEGGPPDDDNEEEKAPL
ncbi:MAG: hypothetical protein AAGB46_08995 [Verrucomicrobiota bacterium]